MFNRPITLDGLNQARTASQLSLVELLEIRAGAWDWNPAASDATRQMALLRVEVELVARAKGESTR